MTNKYLEKIALSDEAKKELAQTGVIGGIGMGTSAVTHKVMNPAGEKKVATAVAKIAPKLGILARAKNALAAAKSSPTAKAALIGGGLGLVGDFAAVKINKAIEKHGD